MQLYVVVPFRNAPSELRASLASLAGQSEAFTAVVVDDASTDPACAEVMASYDGDERFVVLRHEQNTGPAGARHTALAHIDTLADDTDVIVLVDGDDELAHPHVLAAVRAAYDDPHVRMTLGGVAPIGPVRFDDRTYDDWQLDSGHVRWLPWRGHHLRSFRTDLWRSVRPRIHDRSADGRWIPSATDIALLLPMLEICDSHAVHRFDTPMYRYHMARSDNAGFHNHWRSRLTQIASEARARSTPMFPVTLAWWYLPRKVKRALEPAAKAVLGR